ncbi:MAG TPA: hypothetical protein VEE85_02380 [Candidatus Bathyarchaeia archaeon]|nr:hypothetical protein [Candidatus Bathyarchaeia archaeon]
MPTLNEVFSTRTVRRRYEVWFVRLGLADGSGAWWFRYLLMNPGRSGCAGNPRGMPVQVWAAWFPAGGKPQSFIQGFSLQELDISAKGEAPFHFRVGHKGIRDCRIEEESCCGNLNVDGHAIAWDLHYRSTFRASMSSKGWIGFSRTPHSDAVFSGSIDFDGCRFAAEPLGFGLQGHNCGYRHRNFWTWAHACFLRGDKTPSTLEALTYEMPLGLVFRKAVLWHDGQQHVFRHLQETCDRTNLQWKFRSVARNGLRLEAAFDGRGLGLHHLPYLKTDCSSTFEVANNSLASASVVLQGADGGATKLETATGAVLEMVG